jgi:hypothetical protein
MLVRQNDSAAWGGMGPLACTLDVGHVAKRQCSMVAKSPESGFDCQDLHPSFDTF